ncbi:MAG: MBL fold metallo-hydrolase [Candidatus Azambacteria bacterium]|nr:MBL fold metallo-hydrolase [Candidatus Azambacteria bacterium]
MKITFLGTGPSGRIPRPNCGKWYVCKEAKKPGSKSARSQSSAFFEFENQNILIDASLDIKKQLRRLEGVGAPTKTSELKLINPALELKGGVKNKNINAVFLTHGHSDASGGLKYLYQCNKPNNLPIIYTEQKTKEVLNKESIWAGFPFQEIKPFQKINFNNFSVIPFRVEHAFNPKFLTLGFLFEIGGKRVVYASDFKIMPPESKKLIKNADLAILDCAAYNRPIPTHQSFPEILKLVKELNFKKVYLTQVGIAWPHYELAQKIVSKQAKNIFLAYDGREIEI